MSKISWNRHYNRERSKLSYPDENLVRLLAKNFLNKNNPHDIRILDLGCGSGRHLGLLEDMNIKNIFGFDSSLTALKLCNTGRFRLVQNSIEALALKNESADIIIAWGSLHYDYKENTESMLGEIYRVLKEGGNFFCTIRSDRDTYLKKGRHLGNNTWKTELNDLKDSIVSFFSEEELNRYFNIFSDFIYGISERSIMGKIDEIISHWIISAKK